MFKKSKKKIVHCKIKDKNAFSKINCTLRNDFNAK